MTKFAENKFLMDSGMTLESPAGWYRMATRLIDRTQSMNQVDLQAQISRLLGAFLDPYMGQTLAQTKAVKSVDIQDKGVLVKIVLGYPGKGFHQKLVTQLNQCLSQEGIEPAQFDVESVIATHAVQGTLKPMPGVKNIIAVASGKGGVGKSTTAVNTALALHAEGAAVGILDADIYGPSLPQMMGLVDRQPESSDGKSLEPLEAHGVRCMSIGFLIDAEQPMVWRGPMVTQALNQLISSTNWGELDYLIVDMPPGTGDIQLTLSQQVPVSGAMIVTTPQDIALADARKGLQMFRKVNVQVLGIVENMSLHICANCGHQEAIFGSGGGAAMAQQYDVPLLGKLPLDIEIRNHVDSGNPTVATDPDGPTGLLYREIARSSAAQLAKSGKDYGRLFPNIVVEDS